MIDARLQNYYKDIVKLKIRKKFLLTATAKILKVCINIGTRNIVKDIKEMSNIYKDLILITGQKAFFTKAKKSISNFKLRKNTYIGIKITLRGTMMYEFLDRLINTALPKIRDFKGFTEKQFNKSANFSLGIAEYAVFPEINLLEYNKKRGMNITIVTSCKNIVESKFLLRKFNFPFF
jgi:large subunit ribosomal protein L5